MSHWRARLLLAREMVNQDRPLIRLRDWWRRRALSRVHVREAA